MRLRLEELSLLHKQLRKSNAERALLIIQQGSIHLHELAHQLHTSIIEAGHAVNLLRDQGYKVKFSGDVVFIEKDIVNLYIEGKL